MTKQEQINRLTAEFEAAKKRHLWIVDHATTDDLSNALGPLIECASLNELIGLQQQIIKLRVESPEF